MGSIGCGEVIDMINIGALHGAITRECRRGDVEAMSVQVDCRTLGELKFCAYSAQIAVNG